MLALRDRKGAQKVSTNLLARTGRSKELPGVVLELLIMENVLLDATRDVHLLFVASVLE